MPGVMERMLSPIRRKIFLLVGRAILSAVKADEKTMKIQVSGLSNETITDVERLQEYGFDSYPIPGTAEALIVFPNGARDNGVALVVADKESRPTGLLEGDSIMYTKSGLKIWMKNADGKIVVNDGVDFAVRFTELKTGFDQLKTDLNNLITLYNAHIHITTATIGAGPAPGVIAVTASAGTSSTAAIDDSKIEEINLP